MILMFNNVGDIFQEVLKSASLEVMVLFLLGASGLRDTADSLQLACVAAFQYFH